MKKFKLLKLLIIIFLFLSSILPVGAKNPTGKTSALEESPSSLAKTETVEVLRVIDGDTLKVWYGGQEEKVRLIGIDTPESRVNKKALKDAKRSNKDVKIIIRQGKEAAKYVKTLLKPGDTVRLEFDVIPREPPPYKRLLAYVYLEDGKMLNEEIVRAGYANLMTIPPNVKYENRLLEAYREAREMKRGLWGEN